MGEQPYGNLVYVNEMDSDHEMMLIDARDISSVNAILNENRAMSLIFRLLHYFNVSHESNWILIRNSECEIDNCLSFLKMYEVYKGKSHVSPVMYTYTIPNIELKFQVDLDYRQNMDLVEVMDEYNYQNSLIDRYLRIYQAIEYYTYKAKICSVCTNAGYGRLSVRNFKYLSDSLSTNEKESIKELMRKISSETVGATTIGAMINELWDNKINSTIANQTLLSNTLTLLGIRKTKSDADRPITFSNNQLDQLIMLLVDLLYQMRCAIVHDKGATEGVRHWVNNQSIIKR